MKKQPSNQNTCKPDTTQETAARGRAENPGRGRKPLPLKAEKERRFAKMGAKGRKDGEGMSEPEMTKISKETLNEFIEEIETIRTKFEIFKINDWMTNSNSTFNEEMIYLAIYLKVHLKRMLQAENILDYKKGE
ncbi:MAG: hypothetical protein RQM92_00220 [Candidatus Syntrophopropionicum ammoniitolerans]